MGGSTFSSKIRICVRSRMPMMWPCTVTSSPAFSLRISCGSMTGNVTVWLAISELAIEVGLAGGRDVGGGAARSPALVVDRDGVERHVRVGVLDVALEHGHVAAEAHRADAGLVQQAVELEIGRAS